MEGVNRSRPYSSALRQGQAEATRRLVLDAARELFVAQGYVATTMDQIAERAGVSRPTVFRAFGNKQTLLRVVRDVAIAGDDAPVPVSQRPLTAAIGQEPDLDRAIDLLSQHLTGVASRYAAIYEVLRAGAATGEEELARLWETEEEERLTGARHWVDVLLGKGARLREDAEQRLAVDHLWLLMASDQFARLVYRRGWTEQQYRRWLVGAISGVFAPAR